MVGSTPLRAVNSERAMLRRNRIAHAAAHATTDATAHTPTHATADARVGMSNFPGGPCCWFFYEAFRTAPRAQPSPWRAAHTCDGNGMVVGRGGSGVGGGASAIKRAGGL